ncbi:hypothetical protein CDL15_Pgr020466 [Punica granatum]|uniref:Uncharacterized protein n=1 Tax=Punica granatum TaxID=22663 RepID=A0A218VW63_PUNGR|nr:hypothetical protein CDL15_Pgr020466 [Punica granatum]
MLSTLVAAKFVSLDAASLLLPCVASTLIMFPLLLVYWDQHLRSLCSSVAGNGMGFMVATASPLLCGLDRARPDHIWSDLAQI